MAIPQIDFVTSCVDWHLWRWSTHSWIKLIEQNCIAWIYTTIDPTFDLLWNNTIHFHFYPTNRTLAFNWMRYEITNSPNISNVRLLSEVDSNHFFSFIYFFFFQLYRGYGNFSGSSYGRYFILVKCFHRKYILNEEHSRSQKNSHANTQSEIQ